MLFDFESEEIIPFQERNESENNVDSLEEKIFFYPYLSEREKQKIQKDLQNWNRVVTIPNGVKMLLEDDIDWYTAKKNYVTFKGNDPDMFRATIYGGESVRYISPFFFEKDKREKSDNKNIDYSIDWYIESSRLFFRLIDMGITVHELDEEGYECSRIYGRWVDEKNHTDSVRSNTHYIWTQKNTEHFIRKKSCLPESEIIHLVIPTIYKEFERYAFDVDGEEWGRKINIEFRDNMYIPSDMVWGNGVEGVYIPYCCRVSDCAFEFNYLSDKGVVFCEAGSEAEIVANNAGIEIRYFDFEERKEYEKGNKIIKMVELDILDFYHTLDQSVAGVNGLKTLIQCIFKDYILKLNGELDEDDDTYNDVLEKRNELSNYLQECGIRYYLTEY